MKEGEIITEDCIRRIRPGFGLPPKEVGSIFGLSVNRDVSPGEAVTLDVLNRDQPNR